MMYESVMETNNDSTGGLWSFEIPFLLNPINNKNKYNKKQRGIGGSHKYKKIPNFFIENQNEILNLYEKESHRLNTQYITKNPVTEKHPKHFFLLGFANAIIKLPNGENRLIKINSKTKYKYSDSTKNKISSNHLIDLFISMECFDVNSVDYIMFRNNENINVQTFYRNNKFFENIEDYIVELWESRWRSLS